MEVGSVVRAIFDFCPSVSEELTLFAGDVIEVLSVIDEFWILGSKEGITGQFPVSFVEELSIPSLKHGEKLYVCISEFTSHEPGALCLQRGDLVVLEGKLTSSWLQGRSCWGSKGFFPLSCVQEFYLSSRSRQLCQNFTFELPSYAIGQARAILGLSTQLKEELDFREGDIITITGVPESGWFEGELNGQRGIFPEGFVELLNPLRVSDVRIIHNTYDDFKQDKLVEVAEYPVQGKFSRENHRESEDQDVTFAIARYKFEAMEQRELDFEVGDRIKIIQTLEDGWLEGELYGKRGIFPHRFVKLESSVKKYFHQKLSEGTKISNTLHNLDVSSADNNTGSNPHYWDVHVEDTSSVSAAESQVQIANSELHLNSEIPINDYETLCSKSSKPQLPPRPKSKIYSNPANPVQSCANKGKQITSHLPSGSNGSHEKWSSETALSLNTSDEAQRTEFKNKNNRKSSLQYQDIAFWVEDQQQKSKIQSNSKNKQESPSTYSWSSQVERPQSRIQRVNSGCELIDLDFKLSEQLSQFENSLSNSTENGNNHVSRHFSILDYSSETDIIRGTSQLSKVQKSPEKRKILRPPPPPPTIRSNSTSNSSVRGRSQKSADGESTSFPFPLKPFRPAPLPPPGNQRNTPSPKPLQVSPQTENLIAPENHDPSSEECDKGRASPCPFLQLKIEEVERELDVYKKTREELTLMLEEEQDELVRTETIENLEFCDSNIESLHAELQHLKGPEFLLGEADECVQEDFSIQDPDNDPEIRAEVSALVTEARQTSSLHCHRFERFSSWMRLIRTIARLVHIARCYHNTQEDKDCHGWHVCHKPFSAEDISHSESLIIRHVQQGEFNVEWKCLYNRQQIPIKSPLANLNPFIDSFGLLRVGGRLNQAHLGVAEQNPLIIPSKHHITVLLIRHYHKKAEHQGRQITEGKLRSAGLWIIGMKKHVARILHDCVHCRKARGKLLHQQMADLPADRLCSEPPFTYTGLDVFGPWMVSARRTRGGHANSKHWAVLFTCMSVRAVHIEVLESMDTSSLINALRRFFAVRGPVKQLRSDRGSNFIGACRELNIDTKPIQDQLAEKGCTWIFNPPHSSHMGGSWERMIGISRNILNSMLMDVNSSRLTHETLVTLLAEVSAIINSRPLVPVSMDPETPAILTPATLLTQKTENILMPSEEFTHANIYQKHWKRVQYLADYFWNRWRKEYLNLLQGRRKWQHQKPNLKEGDLVLMKEQQTERIAWPIGLITKVFPSEDGKVRKVELKIFRKGELKTFARPINELILILPIENVPAG